MKNNLIKGLSVLAVFVLGVSLAGCGKKEADTESKGDGYVYTASYEKLDMGIGENSYLSSRFIENNVMYGILTTYDEKTYETSSVEYVSLDLATKEMKRTDFEMPEGDMYFQKMLRTDDGKLLAIGQAYDEKTESSKCFLVKYSSDNKIEDTINLNDFMDDGSSPYGMYIQDALTDKDGNIYLLGENLVCVIDSNNKVLCKLTVENWLRGGLNIDGDVYVGYYDLQSGAYVYSKVDLATKSFGDKLEGVTDSGELVSGPDGNILVFTNNSLSLFDVKSKEQSLLFNWIDIDVMNYDREAFSVNSDGTFTMLNQNYNENLNKIEYEVVNIKKVPASKSEKEIMTLGCFYLDYNLKQFIIDFNKSSDKYRITVDVYQDKNGGDYEENRKTFDMDAVSGKFDLVAISDGEVGKYTKKGAFADLNEYFDRDLNRADFFDNVLRAYEMSGKLYMMPVEFGVTTIMAPESVAKNITEWNMDAVIKLRDQYKDSGFLESGTKSGALYTFVAYALNEYIDLEKGDCNFDNEEFVKMLEFANTFPEDIDYENYDSWQEIQSGNVKLMGMSLSDFMEIEVYQQLFGEKLVSLGFPTAEGGKVAIGSNMTLSISEKSKKKDGAWEFIKYLISGNSSNRGSAIPILRSAFNDRIEKETKIETYTDENGVEQPVSQGGWGNGSTMIEYYGT